MRSIIHYRTSFLSFYYVPRPCSIDVSKGLGSSGKCKWRVLNTTADAGAQQLTGAPRYSNTLFVSLNNRIYFRDHPSPGATVHAESGDNGSGLVFNPSGSRPAIAIHVTHVKQPPSQARTGNSFEMGVMTTERARKGDDSDLSMSSDPR